MPQHPARPSSARSRRIAISVLAVSAVAAGSLLASHPALAGPGDLAIASVDIATPSKRTGMVKATITVKAPSGEKVSYSVAKPAKGSASISTDGELRYTPTAGARHRAAKDGAGIADRTAVVRVTVVDSAGNRARKQVRLPILGANGVPVVSAVEVGAPDPVTGVVKGRIVATDPDGDALAFSVKSDIAQVPADRSRGDRKVRAPLADSSTRSIVCPSSQGSLSISAETGAFTYTPTATSRSSAGQRNGSPGTSANTSTVKGAPGTDTFTVTVGDGYGGSVSVPLVVPLVGAPNPSTGVVTGSAKATGPDAGPRG